jgi:hypothetical protein
MIRFGRDVDAMHQVNSAAGITNLRPWNHTADLVAIGSTVNTNFPALAGVLALIQVSYIDVILISCKSDGYSAQRIANLDGQPGSEKKELSTSGWNSTKFCS